MDTSTTIAIISVVIGISGFAFGVYTHFSTRKVSKLTYKISQISDFKVPASFLKDMPRAPVAITLTSRGNKSTENIALRLKAKSNIENFEVEPRGLNVEHNGSQLKLDVPQLNPSQTISLFLRCGGSPIEDQVSDFNLSHSEGSGINEKDLRSITFNVAGIELEYDAMQLSTKIRRIGPIVIR